MNDNFKLRQTKLGYYIPNAKKNEEEITAYVNGLQEITAKYAMDIQSVLTTQNETTAASNVARQKFDKMFEMALADGEISDKEKTILWKYAEAAGIDEGEFELMIENKVNL